MAVAIGFDKRFEERKSRTETRIVENVQDPEMERKTESNAFFPYEVAREDNHVYI